MKVVLDTNVIISGLLWKGLPGEVLERCLKEYTPCFTQETFNELKETLSYPKLKPHLEKLTFTLEEFFVRLTENALLGPSHRRKISVIKEDPSDDKFLACAVACQASFIISGDKHLLKLKEFQGIPIVYPKEFLEIVKK